MDKMTEKFEVIVARKEEATAKRSEPKEEKKAERFNMSMEMQKKRRLSLRSKSCCP